MNKYIQNVYELSNLILIQNITLKLFSDECFDLDPPMYWKCHANPFLLEAISIHSLKSVLTPDMQSIKNQRHPFNITKAGINITLKTSSTLGVKP